MKIPSGERYELCRSVHAEANAIISASRRDMIGSTLYLVGRDAQTGELLKKRNKLLDVPPSGHYAGIERVIIRTGESEFSIVSVDEWIKKRRLRLLDGIKKGLHSSPFLFVQFFLKPFRRIRLDVLPRFLIVAFAPDNVVIKRFLPHAGTELFAHSAL